MSAAATVFDLLVRNLPQRRDSEALVDGEHRHTYGSLAVQVANLAHVLWHLGIRPGDRIVVHVSKSADEVIATLAAARQGAIFVNIHPGRTLDQLSYAIADCGARLAIVDSRRAVELARAGLPDGLEHVLVRGAAPDHPAMTSIRELPAVSAVPRAQVTGDDIAAILYTSGSTGGPKGVVSSHLNLLLGARSVTQTLALGPTDRILSVLPLSFDYGLNQLMTTLMVGGTLVLQPVFMAPEIVRTAQDERITGIAGIPSLWIPIVESLQGDPQSLPHLRYVTNSGGAIPGRILTRLPSVFPDTQIFLMYGFTEAFRSTCLPPELFDAKAGAIGVAVPEAEVYVIADGRVCGPGEQGELVHRGGLVSGGYWDAPELTAARIKPCPELYDLIGDEPVCFSGDQVRIDEDGILWFVGRTDAQIKCSGHRVSPTEVEEVVQSSGLVGQAVAFGVPDERLGEVVHVAVSVRSNRAGVGDEILRFCRVHLPSHMAPRRIHVWPHELPSGPSGKPDRASIARLSAGEPRA